MDFFSGGLRPSYRSPTSQLLAQSSAFNRILINCVIPKSRAFTSGTRELARDDIGVELGVDFLRRRVM